MNKQKDSGIPLWTKDFTILTLGSVVSLFGNTMCLFAVCLFVLDFTDSSFLYAAFLAVYTIPQVVVPMFAGAILDRLSRRKAIYTLDFISTGLYVIAGFTFTASWFSYPMLLVFCIIAGTIYSIYQVAYQSFYPLLVHQENFHKAYSVSSFIEMSSAVMVPVSTLLYNAIGIRPLLFINAASFFIAACFETRIAAKEHYIDNQKQTAAEGAGTAKQMLIDIKEGLQYLKVEKGLLAICIFFAVSTLASGASTVITLPYFKNNFEWGEYIYIIVWGMNMGARALAGVINYRIRIPAGKHFIASFFIYIVVSLSEGFYLFTPIPVMMLLMFANGLLFVTGYTIRLSATQSYVPDEKKGRFNGIFNMLSTVGTFAGNLLAGALGVFFPIKYVLTGFMLVFFLATIFIFGANRKSIKKVYDPER